MHRIDVFCSQLNFLLTIVKFGVPNRNTRVFIEPI